MIDSPLNKEEDQFLIKVSRFALLHKITLFFEKKSMFLINNFIMNLFSNKPDSLSNIFFLETSTEKEIFNFPLNIIRYQEKNKILSLERMLHAIVLNADVQIAVLIFKHRDNHQLRSVLNLLSEINEQPMVIPSSPFLKEYSGNVLAMKEGAEIVYSFKDVISLVISNPR